jgi:ABC-type Na+ efflux pump permease subunit
MREIRALVWKDLTVHGWPAGLLLAGWPVGVRLLVLVPQTSGDVHPDALPSIVTAISLLMFLAVSAGLAAMLVERERSKDTFAWLRTLPVSDVHIVGGKWVIALIFHVGGAAIWWVVLGRLAPPLAVPQIISIGCAMAVIASLALASQIASAGRLAPAVPVAALTLGSLMAPVLSRRPGVAARALELWHGSWQHAWFWAGCLAVSALLLVIACWRFRAQETHALAD